MSLAQRQFEAEAEEESGDWVCKANVIFPQGVAPKSLHITVGRNDVAEIVKHVKSALLKQNTDWDPNEFDMVGRLDERTVHMEDDKSIMDYMNYINNGIILFHLKSQCPCST
ncbi:unnamed protein product [Lymnaea stagnalis]|uniref:Uncharacterized protein n=1 Tax=Lymnaea stagnalis TaxID=6523 RepID=A0AAV2I5V2_LYMST